VLLLERAAQPVLQSVTGSREPDDPTSRRRPSELLEETASRSHADRLEAPPTLRDLAAMARPLAPPNVTHNTEHVFGFLVPEITMAPRSAEHTEQLWAALAGRRRRRCLTTNREAIWQLSHR